MSALVTLRKAKRPSDRFGIQLHNVGIGEGIGVMTDARHKHASLAVPLGSCNGKIPVRRKLRGEIWVSIIVELRRIQIGFVDTS